MIVDITDPKNPVEKFHIPGAGRGWLGQDAIEPNVPGVGPAGRCSGQGLHDAQRPDGRSCRCRVMKCGTSPTSTRRPSSRAMRNLRNTHKHWWECKTGIAYLPGSRGAPRLAAMAPGPVDGHRRLEKSRSARLHPHLRATGGTAEWCRADTPSLHGPISAHEHPNAAGALARPRQLPAGGTIRTTSSATASISLGA